MRRIASFAILASVALAWLGLPAAVHAQGGPGGGGPGGGGHGQQEDEDAKNRKRDQEWGTNQKNLSLPQLRNAGPCPYVKVLYDAARYVELKGGHASTGAVGFTGEIDGLSSACEYKNDQPIHVQARLLFALGRGPQAQGREKTYRYWIAVTDRNRAVLSKQYFDLPVSFPAGQDRVTKTEDVLGIVIPRADIKVSGANFEVLVGFDVTPEMASFNRQGERFRVNAGETTASR
ncbi:MAG TPA: Tat pathway signal sequence domain protein [Caulobacteraceae bacterium]|nr:Tat pathway signal sequence domain protein [Caulobacteraceae bacterium]